MLAPSIASRLIWLYLVTAILSLIAPAIIHAADTTATIPAANAASLSLTGQRVLVLGDSITQDGRYVSYLEYALHKIKPGVKIDIISIGLSSETVSGLSEKGHPFPRPCVLERLERALKITKPTLVLACYGMNDGIYHPPSTERLAAFNAGLHQLITQVRASGAQLVLLTPPVFDPLPLHEKLAPATAPEFGYGSPFAGYDDVLAEFARAELALHEPNVTVIDLHGPMNATLAAQRLSNPSFTFNPDGVHPNNAGHWLIARTILRGLGYSVSETNADLPPLPTEPVFALIHERRELRSEAWLPFVGYSRGEPFKTASVKAAEQVTLRLEREIDALPE